MDTLCDFSSEGAQEFIEKCRKMGAEVESTLCPMMQRKETMENLKGAMSYYRAWQCASQMLADRGYDIDDGAFNIPFSRFRTQHGLNARRDLSQVDLDRLQITTFGPRPSGDKVLVMFLAADTTVTISTLRDICTANQPDLPARVIIIAHAASLPPVYLRAIAAVCPFKVETFHISLLHHNWMRDYMKVRFRFRLLTEEEKTALFFNSAKIQVKGIPPESMIAQYYALEEGMVLEATNVDDADTKDVGGSGNSENDDSDMPSEGIPSELMGEGPHYLVLCSSKS